MPGAQGIAIIATLDTKGPEVRFLVGEVHMRGHLPVVVDVSLLPHREEIPAGSCTLVPREVIARRAGVDPKGLPRMPRAEAIEVMGNAAGSLLRELWAAGRITGALGIGGNQGMALASIAMRHLPLGTPRLIVSTVASGNLRPYLQHHDIAVLFPLADLAMGPSCVTLPILRRAAAAICAMVESFLPLKRGDRPAIALTALGNTHPVIAEAARLLKDRGMEPVVFHASGACGSAMEELVEAGIFAGVLDLTPHELIGEVFGEDIYTPTRAGRLLGGAGRVPRVVAPGGLEYFVFGPLESIPPRFRGRPTYMHNPFNANVQATREEMAILGEEVAKRLNANGNRAAFLLPLRGWTVVAGPGGPLYDPEGNAAFAQALRAHLNPEVRLVEVDLELNDPRCAEIAVSLLEELMGVSLQ
ncbi:MAG: Tm-1-like ATP-binding domain-containing protein [Armatimonadota bacterium]|nr:Tm-1-like ATP-binding domain-containing protein [Armatimonadota bacterium]